MYHENRKPQIPSECDYSDFSKSNGKIPNFLKNLTTTNILKNSIDNSDSVVNISRLRKKQSIGSNCSIQNLTLKFILYTNIFISVVQSP